MGTVHQDCTRAQKWLKRYAAGRDNDDREDDDGTSYRGNLVSAYYGPGTVLSTCKGIMLQSFLQSLEHDDAISIPIL